MRSKRRGVEPWDVVAFSDGLLEWAVVVVIGLAAGALLALIVHLSGKRWTWSALGLLTLPFGLFVSIQFAAIVGVGSMSAIACGIGWRLHARELGGEEAARDRQRSGPIGSFRAVLANRRTRSSRVRGDRLTIGTTPGGGPRSIPFGSRQGVRGLIVGAPGSGKTVTMCAIAGAYTRAGMPVVLVDPKGDPDLGGSLVDLARGAGADVGEWSAAGPDPYNPIGRGEPTEIADKLLAGESWSEPHYLRQAQRYLGWVLRLMEAGGRWPASLAAVVSYMDPERLDGLADRAETELARRWGEYLDSLSPRARADLGGVRDRIAILAESKLGAMLEPSGEGRHGIDLADRWGSGSLVSFRMDSDLHPLASEMLGAAIVSDLVSLTGELQGSPALGLVAIDEFAAIGATEIVRLLARSRSAGISVLLATQGLADLGSAAEGSDGEQLASRILSQVDFVVVHRQPEPTAAELLGEMAGTRPAWIMTKRVQGPLQSPTGEASRSRGREFIVHPDTLKRLPTGEAVVIEPARAERTDRVRIWPLQMDGAASDRDDRQRFGST